MYTPDQYIHTKDCLCITFSPENPSSNKLIINSFFDPLEIVMHLILQGYTKGEKPSFKGTK